MADITPLKWDATNEVVSKAQSGDTVGVPSGGTGKTSITQHALLKGGAANTYSEITVGSEGQVLQVASGTPAWGAAPATNYVSKTNDNAGTVVAGAPVYVKSNGNVDKAKADAIGTAWVFGLAQADIAASAAGNIQFAEVLTLTTTQWDAVTGQSGGLTAGERYWLDAATAGKLTTTAPSTAGQFSVYVMLALSTTTARIHPGNPIGM